MTAFALGVVFAGAASAQDPCEGALTPFLYRVSKDGRTSHLVGTMHVGVDLDEFSSTLHHVLDRATSLSIECKDPTARSIRSMQADCARKGAPRLSTQLSATERARYVQLLEENGLPAEFADELSPFGANMSTSAWYKILAENTASSLDTQIARRFANRPVTTLETIAAAHRANFEAMDVQRLRERLDPKNDVEPGLLIRAYRAGDEAAILALMGEARRQSPRWYRVLLTERNARWMPNLIGRHRLSRRHVSAVGVAHFFGEDGLIELLRSQGFTVRRRL